MGDIKASPRNRLLGLLAEATQGVNEFASKPFGYNNPPGAMLAGLFGLPGLSNTMNELSYGGALGTGSGMTWKPKADTVDAAMTLLPIGATAGKAAIDGGVALAKKAAPAIERAVPRVMERGGLSSQLLRDLSQNTVSPATVWHGSPHKFDKFDSSKIGTGEGAQAYGHGLYLAENQGVAEGYKNGLSAPNQFLYRDLENVLPNELKGKASDWSDAILQGKGFDDLLAQVKLPYQKTLLRRAKPQVDELIRGQQSQGSLYKVDLPDDAIAKMLDWDKPLSQQPAAYQIKAVLDGKYGAGTFDNFVESGGAASDLVKNFDDLGHGGMESLLKQQGIPGIRYLDGGSRGTGAGTSNFVVFPGNEGLLTILERNGQPMGLLGR